MHTERQRNLVSAWLLQLTESLQEASEDAAVPGREAAALVLVHQRPGRSADWLRQRLRLTHSGTVRLIDRMAAEGLIRRERTTGREVALHITETGREHLARLQGSRSAAFDAMLGALDESEQEQLTHLIEKLLAAPVRRRDEADGICRLCDWTACGSDCPVDTSVQDSDGDGRRSP
jgi:DNA-binding MarR family transcriptional regulator